jgi:hypothetical protein
MHGFKIVADGLRILTKGARRQTLNPILAADWFVV